MRNAARLPDTKVVRTAFFINGASVSIALGLLLWFAYREYQLHQVEVQIAIRDSQIVRDKKDSDQFVALYGKFQAEQAKVNEVNNFVKSRPIVSKLLMRLGETLPKEIALDAFEEGGGGVTFRGTIRGTPDEASGFASAYLDQLRADKVLAQDFDDYAFSGPGVSRNGQARRLNLQLFLRFRPRGGKK